MATASSAQPNTSEVNINKIFSTYLPLINSTLEKWIPRYLTEQTLESLAGHQRYSYDLDAINKTITEPIWDLLDRGGKRWRSTLLLIIAEALGKKYEDMLDFVVITEIVHNGTLVVDDIEDNSDFRRGKPCLHKITGVDVAINAGNAMYFLPLRVLKEHRSSIPPDVLIQCYEVVTQEMINLHLGQGLDIWWHSKNGADVKEPTIENYFMMCANKTGALARMSAKISALICGGNEKQVEAIGKFAESIGIAFQIQDDILNIEQGTLSGSKGGAGEDIHEGKRTIMVLHSFHHSNNTEGNKRLKEILTMKTNDPTLINEAIDILHKNGSVTYAKKRANQLIEEAWSDVSKLLPDSLAKNKLKVLVDFLVQRDV